MQLTQRVLAEVMQLSRDLADVALSRACVGCGREGPALCDRCSARLPSSASRRDRDPVVWYAGEHEGLVRDLVLAHKERGVRALTPALGRLLAQSVLPAMSGATASPIALVQIPPHRRSIRARGRDSLGEMAHAAGRVIRAHGQAVVIEPILEWRHENERHAGRSARERWELSDAFQIRSRRMLPNCAVVVDDVVTTGATVGEAVRVLRAAGVHVLSVACVASRALGAR